MIEDHLENMADALSEIAFLASQELRADPNNPVIGRIWQEVGKVVFLVMQYKTKKP